MAIDVLDLAIICGDARQKLSELLGKGGIDVGQFSVQLVALGLDPIIDELTPLVLFLLLQFFEPLRNLVRRLRGALTEGDQQWTGSSTFVSPRPSRSERYAK
jgi:hypothetical protein